MSRLTSSELHGSFLTNLENVIDLDRIKLKKRNFWRTTTFFFKDIKINFEV